MSNENEFISQKNLRLLAMYILNKIGEGDTDENLKQVSIFIVNMVGGLLLGGAPNLESAFEGLDALYDDIEEILNENFDAAKAAMSMKSN
jgi:hypothetical protein